MRGQNRRSQRGTALVVALVTIGMMPTAVEAGGNHGGGSGGGSGGGHGGGHSSCGVYPIGVKASLVAGKSQGAKIDDLTVGAPSGHQGWLTWKGESSEIALARSLTPPGDSDRYKNPDDPADRLLSTGDWVSGRPGAASSWVVGAALDRLSGKQIVVPVWDTSRSTSNKVAYHVTGFVEIKITSYKLGRDNKVSAKYLGPSKCGAPVAAPVAQPTSATTAEDRPTTIVLTGSSEGGRGDLQFALAPPTSGSVALIGAPTCKQTGSSGDDDWGHAPPGRHHTYARFGKNGSHGSWPLPGHGHPGHGQPGHGSGKQTVTCTATASYTPAADFVGLDTFTFTVSDGQSSSVPATVTVTVTEVNDPPVAGADSGSTDQDRSVAFDVATLLANDVPGPANESGQRLAVSSVTGGAAAHGTVGLAGGVVTYTPAPGFSGSATFTYTLCDDGTTAGRPDPRCADGVVTVLVSPSANQPPVADDDDVTLAEDTSVAVTLAGSDADGDSLEFAVSSAPQHGTLSGDAPDLTYTPAPDFYGLDSFTFTVADGTASSVPATVAITVTEVNDPPAAGPDSLAGQVGEPVTVDPDVLLANDIAGPANESAQTMTLTAVTAGPDTHGTVELDGDTITYTPDQGVTGTATFTYTVCDDGTTAGEPDPLCDATGTVTVTFGAPNQPPVADPQAVEVVEDEAVEITLTGSDPEAAPITFAVVSQPTSGSLSGTAPDLVYAPSTDYFGFDAFTFTVSDGQASSVPATVSITVSEVNDPPVAGADSVAATGHQPASISVASLLDNDTPGPSNESTQTLSLTVVSASAGTHGTVSLSGGAITFIPDLGFAGVATFTYQVCDNGTTAGTPDPRCSEGLVTVTVAAGPNAPPLGDEATLSAVEDTPQPITLTAFDADGDPLEFGVAGSPAHGTLMGTAPDLVYTPAPDYFGPDEFTFTASDSLASSVPAKVTIDVSEVNDPPVAGADTLDAVTGEALSVQASALLVNDVPGPTNESGQQLSATAVTSNPDTHGTVSIVEGTITYTPDVGFAGTATFAYTVCDNGTTDSLADPLCAAGNVTVEVFAPSEPPTADPQAATLAEDTPTAVTLSGSDPEGAPLTFAIVAAPQHGTVSSAAPTGLVAAAANEVFTYTPDADYFGPDSFTFTASDGLQVSDPATVSLTVTEVNDPPVAAPDFTTLGGAGTLPPPPPAPLCGPSCGVIYGDPHLMSFDEAAYDAQAAGEVIVAKSTTDDFEVQARFTPVPGSRIVSINTALAMRVAGHRVTTQRTTTGIGVNIDGAPTTVPATPMALPGGGTIGTYGDPDQVIVVWPDGSLAIISAVGVYPEYYRFTVELGLAPARLGQVVGMLGDADGNRLDDLFTRTGQAIAYPDTPFTVVYGTWVNSWRISNAESLFDYGPGQTTETFTDLTFPDAPATPQNLPSPARASATTICGLFGLTTQALIDACIVDVGTTGDADFANTAAAAQQSGLGIPSNAGATEVGAATTVATTVPGETAVRTFTAAAAGARFTLTVSDNTFAGGVDIVIRGPNGSTVASQFVSTGQAFRDVFAVPAAGTYTVQIDPRDQQTGSLTFLLAAVPDNTGTTAIGTPTTITTTVIGENATRTFTGTAGQKVTLFVSGNTFNTEGVDLSVLQPNGGTVSSLFASTASAFRDVFTLPVTGTYTIVVDPRQQQVGSLTFLLAAVPDNTGTTALNAPTSITTTVIGENATRTFTGTAGQKVTLFVSGNTFNSDGVDLSVLQPNGGTVSSLFAASASGFRDVFTLPVTGTYTIVVDPRQQQVGSLTFLLAAVPDNTGTTSLNAPTSITTTVIGENATRTLTGTAGQKVTLFVSGNTFTSDGVDLSVLQPNGGTVGSLFAAAATGFRDVFTLPVTGTYTIVVDPRQQQTGGLTFLLAGVPDNTGTTAINSPTSIATTVIGENATRTFTGTAGQKVTLFVSGNTFNSDGVDVSVVQPNGGTVASVFTASTSGFRDVFTLPVTGTYTVDVNPRQQQVGGLTFRLAAVPDNTGTTSIGTPTTITTTVIGENASRTFTATAGQQLTLTVSNNTYNDSGADISVRNPAGTTVASLFAINPTAFRDVFTLPVTGTYTIDIDPRQQQTGGLTFLLAQAAGITSTVRLAPAGIDEQGGVDSTTPSISRVGQRAVARAETESPAITLLAAAEVPTLTIAVADLLLNDRPGPANESDQSLTLTTVTPGPFTHGTVALAAGVINYTPDADFVGNASIGYTVCDDGTTAGVPDPRCSTGTINITVTANHPPVIGSVTVVTVEDTPVALTLTGSDPDGDPVNFVLGAPGHGVLTGPAPTLTYQPAPDFNGTDTFTYTANDGHDQSAPATVTITVTAVNDPPVAKPDTVTRGAGQTASITVATLLSNDAAGPFDENGQHLTVTAVTSGPDTHGTVAFNGSAITYQPDALFVGAAVIAYTICDDGTTGGLADPLCADSTLSISLNAPPVATPQSAQTSRITPIDFTLTATDPDGDTLTLAIASPPQHGTLTGMPPDVRYRANAGYIGDDSFTFTATDAFNTSAPATVSITVNSTPAPTLGHDSATVRPGESALIGVLDNDTPGSGVLAPATLTVSAAPTRGVAVAEGTKIRYTPGSGQVGSDTFSYTVCDTGGGCATALVDVQIAANHAPVAAADSYDVTLGTTLNIAAPGVLGNDTDADAGDRLQSRLVTGVTNGRLLLYGTGAFTYTPNGPGIDTFVYRVTDRTGAVSGDVTVTLVVSGPPGPPIAGNDLFEVAQGSELVVAAPGLLEDDYSPNPRLTLTPLLQRDAAKGTLLMRPDGSFTYTPVAGFTGIDQFSYVVRDSEGRLSGEAYVGITVTSGGPATATVGSTSPDDGAVVLGPTLFTATLVPPPGENVTAWSVSYRQPGGSTLVPLATGTGNAVAAEFDPTLVRNGTYLIVVRAETSGGGVLVDETGVVVDGDYKPGRYTTTFRDVAVNSANIPIDLLRTYDSTNRAAGDFGPGWSLAFGGFKVESNGPLGAGRWTTRTCGSFPFLATCYDSSKPHIVTVTWPDGHVERFRFVPNQGSQLVPTITTAGFQAELGTTSTLDPFGNGLLLSGNDFLLGDFFSSDGVYDPVQFVLTDKSGIKYRIDKRAGLLSITDRNGNVVELGDGGLASSTGIAMSFVRDASNRITRIVAPGGNIDYGYDAAGDLVTVAYPNGTQQSFTYDGEHNLLTVTGGGQLVRTVNYDDDGRVTSITDGNGNTSTISSDVAGHQSVETDATGQLTTVTTYDDRGGEVRVDRIAAGQSLTISAAGQTITTTATYDSLGRQLSVTDGLGHTNSQTYDASGNVATETDANGRTTSFTYNSRGQMLTSVDPLGHTTTNTYDSRGNLTATTDADGTTTRYTYDADGNLLTATDPVGRTVTRTYDANGLLATVTDPGGHTTHQTVDADTGLLTSVTDPTGATTSYGYDAVGNLTSITDANHHTRSAGYDAFDRITSLTDPTGASLHMAYDSNDNLTSVTDRIGQVTTYGYDATSRLVSKNVPGAGATTFTYDPFGRMTAAANNVAQLTFTFDDADRVLTATSTPVVPGALPTSTLTYAYDNAGNVTSTQGPGGPIGYSYDANSQLATITDPASGVFDFDFDTTGRMTSMSRPNGITDATSYNAAGDITTLRSTLGPTLVNRADYTYNATGLRSSYTSLSGATTYTYDGASQLTSATPPGGSGLPNEHYTYDPVGNRISSATSPLGSFSYDSGDRLLGDATYAYTYDAEGNLRTRTLKTTGATTTYTWTAERQLVAIAYPDNTTSTFRYDPLGRRVEVSDAAGVTRYAFDQQAIAAEYDASNTLAAHYIQAGPGNPCPLEMVRDGQRYFYLVDGRQSTTALTDINGVAVSTYRYEAFGTPLQTGSLENPLAYLCIYVYGVAGLGFPSSGPYDPASGQSLNDSPLEPPGPNPYNGGGSMPAPGGTGGRAGGGTGGGGAGGESGGAQCAGGKGPKIYPKGWKGLGKGAKKLMAYPKRSHPKKGAGTEYVGLLPTQETVQAVADYGFIVRCQFAAAADSLGP